MKKWWSDNWPIFAGLGVVCLFVGGPVLFVSLSERERDAREALLEARCGMQHGDIVEAAIDGRRGMVTGYRGNWVWVRFAQPHATTDVALLGGDGPIGNAPYSEVRMACFELREVLSVE